MQPEQIVSSYDLCKRLAELGFSQHGSYFYFYEEPGCERELLRGEDLTCLTDVISYKMAIAAPTAEELWKYLPVRIKPIDGSDSWLHITKETGNTVCYYDDYIDNPFRETKGEALANTLATLLIWLAENGYVDFKQTT